MRRDRTGEAPVSYEEAVRRVRKHAGARRLLASNVAGLVWPANTLKPQGAALAVAPFLRRMLKDGVLSHDYDGHGYRVRTGSTT